MSDPDRLVEARLLLAAAEAEARIASCHEEVACPACGAPVGVRCRQLRSRTGKTYAIKDSELKHPHRRRWSQVVPPR